MNTPGYLSSVPGSDEVDPATEEREAIARIAFSYDGLLMHRFLRRTLEAVFDLEPVSALPFQNGRRSLARDLMRLMAEGIEGQTSGRTSDSAILTRAGSARSARAFRGAARRVAPDPELERLSRANDDAIAGTGTSGDRET
jgi:hypothetical protein